MRFSGKVALVTGAQQGIGRAVALALAAEGADVAVNWLDDAAAAEAVAAAVQERGRRALLVQADVSRAAEAQGMVETVLRELGGVDVLVNNAGVYPRSRFLDLAEAEWDHVLGVNLKGTFLCAQAAARAMAAQGRGGVIVNLSSSAVRGIARGVHYSASKGGILVMTRSMALELAPHGIRVNAVAPGLTDTAQPRLGHDEAALQALSDAIPLGHMAQPGDIAAVILWLASDEARFVTGHTVFATGGSYMG